MTEKTQIKKLSTEDLTNHIIDYNDFTLQHAVKNADIFSLISVEFMQREDNMDFYQLLLDSLIEQNGPHNDEVLHFYIAAFLGFNIPRRRFCRTHEDFSGISPFKFVSDMFFERTRNAIAFANRTGGKTLNIAILNHLDMLFKPGCEIASAGATRDQADKMYDYFRGFHDKNEFLADFLAREPTKTYAEYKNGSRLYIITGSDKGLRSPHPNKARIDEVEMMEWKLLQAALSMAMTTTNPATGREIMAQNCFSSTRQHDTGTMENLLTKAREDKREHGGMDVYCWCIKEVLEPCTRRCYKDDYWGTCPLIEKGICSPDIKKDPKEHGWAHRTSGYYKLNDFIDKCLTMDRDTLDTEWFNMKPSKDIFVYGAYWKKSMHIISEEEMRRRLEGKVVFTVSAIDFGSSPGHDYVYAKFFVDFTNFKREVEEAEPNEVIRARPIFYLFYEYRSAGANMLEHADKMKISPAWKDGELIFADPSSKQERLDLEEIHGIPTEPANRGEKSESKGIVEAGIEQVRIQLKVTNNKAHFYIVEGCLDCDSVELVGTAREFELYKYTLTKEGKPNRKQPLKLYDHGMDCVRYAVNSTIPYFRELFMPVFEEIEEDGYWFG